MNFVGLLSEPASALRLPDAPICSKSISLWNARSRGPVRVAAAIMLTLSCISLAGCQEAGSIAQLEQEWMVGIHGVVIDTLTKKPVAGAMVYLDRDPPLPPGAVGAPPQQDSGRETRTDGDGRFRFTGVDLNTHYLSITKAGYTTNVTNDVRNYHSYEIQPGAHMGELRFFLTPTGEITGRVSSDKEQSISGMQLLLYKELIDDGRGVWQKHGEQVSDAHGAYSFTGLKPGTYVVVSSWLVDNDPGHARGPGCSSYQLDPRSGYAPEAYPGVLDFFAAAPIVVAQGQRATADLKLQHQVFHTVTLPPGRGSWQLVDHNGRELRRDPPPGSQCGWSLPGNLDRATGRHTINLPDGTYTMPIHDGGAYPQGPGKPMKLLMANFTTFTVAGGPLTVPDTPEHPLPAPATRIHPHYDLTAHPCDAPQGGPDPPPGRPTVWLSHANPLPEKAVRMGEMRRTNDLDLTEFTYLAPGRYWVHASEVNAANYTPNTYIASVTAGGADMLREPLVVGADGTSPPLEITVRNDCGSLRVKYTPANPYREMEGVVEPFYGMLVPQFSGWVNAQGFTFEENTPWLSVIRNLPPGHYKFYVTRQEMSGIEFRDPAKLAADLGQGQDVWLKAGGKAEVSVTEPPAE
jgi:hypothetical protein